MDKYYLNNCINRYTKEQKHATLIGKEIVILEAEIGKPAWLCVKTEEDEWCPWHRIRTSTVKDVVEYDDRYYGKIIEIHTNNSIYYIEPRVR